MQREKLKVASKVQPEKKPKTNTTSEEEEEVDELYEERVARRLVCVIGLGEGSANSAARLADYQRHVHDSFAAEIATIIANTSAGSYEVQYAVAAGKWHLGLMRFLEKRVKLAKNRMNFLLFTPDNEAFSVVQPTSCTWSDSHGTNSKRVHKDD